MGHMIPGWMQAPHWMDKEDEDRFYMGLARYLAITETGKAARRQMRDYTRQSYQRAIEAGRTPSDHMGVLSGPSGGGSGGGIDTGGPGGGFHRDRPSDRLDPDTIEGRDADFGPDFGSDA